MATSGAMSTSNEYVKYTIAITQNSQDVANNRSSVTVAVRFYRTNTGYKTYGTGTVYCRINGTLYSEAVTKADEITSGGIVLFTKTLNITHNADGTKTLSASAWINHDAPLTSNEQSYSQTLTTIPRASQPSCITWPEHTQNVGYFGDTISIHMNRASSNFTHTVRYQFGQQSGTIATGVGTGTTWTIPTSFMNLLPNSTSGSGTIYVDTYSGSTKIGTKYCGFTASVPASVKPSCSIQVLDATDYKNKYGNLVQGLSKLVVNITATAAYSAKVVSGSTTITNGAASVYSGMSFTSRVLSNSGTVSVSSTVKDERGRTSASASASFPVIAYQKPQVYKLAVHRCAEDGTEDEGGEFCKVNFSAQITALNNKNSARYYFSYTNNATNATTEDELTDIAGRYTVSNYSIIFPADSGSSYGVRITATDDVYSISSSASVSTAFTLFNCHKSGTGFAFGKVAETPNTVEFGLDCNFIGKIKGTIFDAIYPVNSIYISYSHTNPSTLFGGTWVRLQNAFLWGVDSSGTIGQTGGEKTHTLTANEIPSHNHGGTYTNAGTATKTHAWLASGGSSMAYDTVNAGGGAAHNNMPPYVQVSIWRRTA